MSNRKNLANGILADPVNETTTTWPLESGYGAGMPDVPFYLTATPFGQLSTIGNSEIVNVTARTDDTLTVERGAKGTTAKAFEAGAVVSNGIYVEDLNSIPGDLDVDGDIYSNGKSLGDMFYPIGSTYYNKTNPTNPATLLGFGTWERLEGVVLGGRSETTGSPFNVAAGTVIGADTHTLTVDEMPSHNHAYRLNLVHSDGQVVTAEYVNAPLGYGDTRRRYSDATENEGGGGSHPNIQRTLVGYLWERTA